MRRRVVTVALLPLLAVATEACGTAESSPPAASKSVVVPRVVGGDSRTHAVPPLPCDEEGVAVAPDPTVKQQRPRARRQVPRGSVVVLEDECTLLRFKPRGAGCQ
jgi:hypothetical protein